MTETQKETYNGKVPEYTKRAILKYFHKQYATNDEFRAKHIERGKTYYKNNNDLCKVKRRYRYWEKKGDLEKYKIKYPDDIPKLIENGYIQENSDDENYTNSPGEIIQEYSNSE
tara:strand:- start:597 stop:938 length:342 start_codon:yes stop_codon:yes gene_type:complete